MPGMRIDRYVIASPKDDKRVKLLPEEKERVRELSKEGWSQRQLAREFKVSRRLIQFILDPAKLKRVVELHDSKKYYPGKEEWTKQMRKHRAHKKQLLEEGKLKQVREKAPRFCSVCNVKIEKAFTIYCPKCRRKTRTAIEKKSKEKAKKNKAQGITTV